ncbi:Syntaxin-like protein psy1 [Ceratocystis fimbriata CBS 114723]|uniref:Syntaxin-like protein psy1 n=1 Tax=Ceratocystis fimbriata CBS 114723 TaxID=1035309 RepID=A0A2C5X800_9PEZI|nr:Syntaxin-like protein psy1 [Ceratocystis fimbriata CBS 114723]
MSYGYGNQQNPFEQGQYGGNQYNNQSQQQYSGSQGYGGGDQYGGGGGVEMSNLPSGGGSSNDPNAILNECRDIDNGINEIERSLEQLRMLQQRSLDDADTSAASATNRQLDQISSDTMNMYRSLTDRIRQIKSNPESRQPKNSPQVGRIDRRLKTAINNYQQVESAFRKRTQEQMARQFRIVRPDASEEEVRAAVEDTSASGQVFSQALKDSNRMGNARAALNAVQDRHQALLKIESQIVELAQLFQDLDTLIVQQEETVVQMEQKAEEIVENMDKGNEEIDTAITSARSARRKKWWCLAICIAIVVVIVIIVVVYLAATGKIGGSNNNNNKRSLGFVRSPSTAPVAETIPIAARALSDIAKRQLNTAVPREVVDKVLQLRGGRWPGMMSSHV